MSNNTQLPPPDLDGEPLDKGIEELVHYLREGGFPTIASCQGKSPSERNHSFNMPVVRIQYRGTNTITFVKDTVKALHKYMAAKYKQTTVQTQITWGSDGHMTRVLYDVMFVKSVKEEFDIAKYRK